MTPKAMDVLKDVEEKIKKIKAPTGEADSPAVSCHDFKVHNPELADGKITKIWIDPNLGNTDDKVQVVCEFRSKITWTCIHPSKYSIAKSRWAPEPLTSYTWFSDIQKAHYGSDTGSDYEFMYDASRSQINALAAVSSLARQTIMFKCKNTKAYYNAETQGYESAIQLRSFDEHVITAAGNGPKRGMLRYDVDPKDDNCMAANADGTTKIDLRTRKITMLPVIDIALRHAGADDQEFGFELDSVCFGNKDE